MADKARKTAEPMPGGLTMPSNPALELQRLMQDEGRRASTGGSYDKSYGNMTSHTDDKQESHADILPDSPQEGQAPGHTVRRKVSRTSGRPERRSASPSTDLSPVRRAILATVQQGGQAGEVLKTVTIKLAPSLDRRVEEHCFATGRKKQEVVRDALMLYFELLEEGAGED